MRGRGKSGDEESDVRECRAEEGEAKEKRDGSIKVLKKRE